MKNMMKNCEHKRTRKLFWMNHKKNWVKTNKAFCLDCKKIIHIEVNKREVEGGK